MLNLTILPWMSFKKIFNKFFTSRFSHVDRAIKAGFIVGFDKGKRYLAKNVGGKLTVGQHMKGKEVFSWKTIEQSVLL